MFLRKKIKVFFADQLCGIAQAKLEGMRLADSGEMACPILEVNIDWQGIHDGLHLMLFFDQRLFHTFVLGDVSKRPDSAQKIRVSQHGTRSAFKYPSIFEIQRIKIFFGRAI